ncbi:MAG TPA: bifunctional serine/threonine-protein kinase/formylglycine-generating enzyme family protein [Pyrinomonadaceae bacterium]|jgi:serine/threonine protein kinase/formylglycine-generating enzyme required for sulfatase activity|nr:bifunctional serine/threonine-protein kinase/formylglycine-generating enzyme family protein [Pyrinomonadaceae bacterium]
MKECQSCHRCYPDKLNHCPSDGDSLKFLINLDTTLDERYLLEKKLGQGGMGLVFKAHHKFIKTQHAIKIILPDLVGNDPSLAARFRQEAMAAAAIRHPNTVSVTDYGILDGTTPYLVMEFVEGQSLHEVLAQQKRISPAESVRIMLAICAGVGAAHRQGIVHRDLKPLNIMLRPGEPPGESLKVLDFGLAKIKSGDLLGSLVAVQTQGMMGSPFYMAPEQWHDDDEIDVRADIYSLGVILYQMLAGDVPFKGKSIPVIMNMHLNTAAPPLGERGVEVPEALQSAVSRALEKEPAKRPQTVEEFAAELHTALQSLGEEDSPAREVGAQTVQIGRVDTTDLREHKGSETGLIAEGAEGLKTVAGVQDVSDASGAGAPWGSGATVAEPPADNGDARISETGRQSPAQTFGQFNAATPTQHFPKDALTEPLTGMPDSVGPREEEQQHRDAELLRQREEEESRLREAQERERREAEERRRREAGERQSRPTEVYEAPAALAAQQQSAAQSQQQTGIGAQQQYQHAGEGQGQYTPTVTGQKSSRAPFIILGVAALVLLVGFVTLAYFVVLPRLIGDNTNGGDNTNVNANTNTANTNANVNANVNANTNVNTNANSNGTDEPVRADLVALPAGTFKMGRSDVPPVTDSLRSQRPAYLLWMYNQWPAHDATVGAFAIDRTEVTNAEYADFVKATNHAPPSDWGGTTPPAGRERLPVANVSFDDANAFAAWRSRRDGVTYRLPTEEEWEYAALGGGASQIPGAAPQMYPWGAQWSDGRANLAGAGPKPVGSFALGRTTQGLDDMIGNVWEWTTSEAAMYKGNDRTAMSDADKGKLVVRGGSYESKPDGDEPATVTSRRWVARDIRSPVLGFRLVRGGR